MNGPETGPDAGDRQEKQPVARRLMELFFQAPAACALLVFDDNDYIGVVLKRDIEIGISEGHFVLIDNINYVAREKLPSVIFRENGKGLKVPVIDRNGDLVRIISHEEFECHFHFEHFLPRFHGLTVFDHLDHPLVITSHFRKVVYANRMAMDLFKRDLVGKNLAPVLREFHMNMVKDTMILEQNGALYRLLISHSVSRDFSGLIYQFFRTL